MLDELSHNTVEQYNYEILIPEEKTIGKYVIEPHPVHYTMEAGVDPTMALVLNEEVFYCPHVNIDFWESGKSERLKKEMNQSKLAYIDNQLKKPHIKVAYHMSETPHQINMDFLKEVYMNEISLLGEGGGYIYKEIPDRFVNSLSTEWKDFTIHQHVQKGKVHTDIRLDVGDHLEGFLLFTPNLENLDEFHNASERVKGVLKGPQSMEWKEYEGITETNEIFFKVAQGKYRMKEASPKKLIIEFKSDEGKINKEVLSKAENLNLNIMHNVPRKYKKLTGLFSISLEEIYPTKHFVFIDKVEKEDSKRRVSNEQLQDIYNLSLSGLNRPEIADKVDLCLDTVWRYQKMLGLQ